VNSERWTGVFSGLVLLFALHLGLLYFSSALLVGGLSAALLLLVLLTATCGGRMLLRPFEIRRITESEKTLIGATLGLGILSQGLLLLAVLGILKAWAVSLLLGGLWIIGFTEMQGMLDSLKSNLSLLRDRPLMAGGVLFMLGLMFWFTWVPPHQYDALVYHLPLADAYAREGALTPLPHLLFSHFPQNGEMLYALGLLLGTDILAQMFTWLGTFLSVWWLFEMGKRELPVGVVLLGCLLTVTHTAVLLLTPTAYVEPLVMLWVTASFLSFLRWRMASDEETSARGWLALAGVFAGLGIGTKYYAGITPILLGAYLLAQWLRMRPWSQGGSYVQSRLKDGGMFAACTFAAGFPWLLKNALVVGNPVFPFLYKLWPPRGVDWGPETAARYFEILSEYGHQKGRLLADLLSFPYLAATGSVKFGGGADILGDMGWGLLLIAAPAAIWSAWKSPYVRAIVVYVAAHGLIWFATGTVLRFLIVIIPLASLAVAHGLHKVWGKSSSPGRWALGAGAAALVCTNLMLFTFVHELVGSLKVLVGLQSRSQYLAQRLDYYPCAAFARERVDEHDKILVVGEQRGYYVTQPHTATTLTAPNRFVVMANESANAAELARRLNEEGGYSWMLFVPRESKRLGQGYGVFHFSERGYENWSQLESRHVEAVFQDPGRCVLYRLRV
jgi:hypothetical protein